MRIFRMETPLVRAIARQVDVGDAHQEVTQDWVLTRDQTRVWDVVREHVRLKGGGHQKSPNDSYSVLNISTTFTKQQWINPINLVGQLNPICKSQGDIGSCFIHLLLQVIDKQILMITITWTKLKQS